MPDSLPKLQLDIYRNNELPRLDSLIEAYSLEYGGSITRLLEEINRVLKANGIPGFSSNDISALRRDDKGDGIKKSAYSDRTIYRLAIGLQIDPDPAWGYAILRMYLLGLIEGIDPEAVILVKSACTFPEAEKEDLENPVLQEILSRVTNLETRLHIHSQSVESVAANYVLGILDTYGLTKIDVLINTSFSSSTWQEFTQTGRLPESTKEELETFLNTISGLSITIPACNAFTK